MWFVVWVPTNVVVLLVDTFLAEFMLTSIDRWDTYVFIAFPLETLIYVYLGAFIYKKFSNIKISKVMPFIWFFMALNFAKLYSEVSIALDSLDKSMSLTSLIIILCYFGMCLGFRYQFIKSKQW